MFAGVFLLAGVVVISEARESLGSVPPPLAFWSLQEATGQPRVSRGLYRYELRDGNATAPVHTVSDSTAPFGRSAAHFAPAPESNNSARLFAPRASVPALTSGIAGPLAQVTVVAWMKRSSTDLASGGEGMAVGVWNEHREARQYAMFTDLAVCSSAPVYKHGLAAHVSNNGGPTPGHEYSETRACDPGALPSDDWHCLAIMYDGMDILAFVNGTFRENANSTRSDNPFVYPGGIYDPDASGAYGAEFALGANLVNVTVGGPGVWHNQWYGLIGGVAVWNTTLDLASLTSVCAGGAGFEPLAHAAGVPRWDFPWTM